MKYDIIGDVHGQATLLKNMLKEFGYSKRNGSFEHAERKAIFVGDFINRGPEIRETVKIIRSMVEDGNALCVLGNHELNAIIFNLKDQTGTRFFRRSSKMRLTLMQTLSEFSKYQGEWKSHLKWMRSLPMYLDLGKIRVVHACWQDDNIQLLKEHLTTAKLKKSFLRKMSKNNTELSRAFWETCKGIDFQMPRDLLVFDDLGRAHRSFRSKWWINPSGKSFKELSFETRFELPSYTIPEELIIERKAYNSEEPIVFFGHYCLKNGENILSHNLCCLDSCVSKNGKLTAYQWNGESRLIKEHLRKISFKG